MLWVTVWTSWWSWAIWGRRVCRVGTKEHLPSRLWSYNKWQHPGQAPRCSYWPGPWRNGCRLCFCSLGSLATQRIKRGKWHVRKLASKKNQKTGGLLPQTHLQGCSQYRVRQLPLLQAASASSLQTSWGSKSGWDPQPEWTQQRTSSATVRLGWTAQKKEAETS